jgi:hypothetical protein
MPKYITNKALNHGKASTYDNYGCRCDLCKAACSAYRKLSYTKYRERTNAAQRNRNKIRITTRKEIIIQAKNVPCKDCGQRFPSCCMDFDHLPEYTKKDSIGKFRAPTKKSLLTEIAKCEVVCSNCHRIRTKNRGYEYRPKQPLSTPHDQDTIY